ncbi:hypothetical protein B0T14DRAFT_506744 [Immersiella caudata]|uniref:Uncharacterized protein n=1 Tax=Immersiella caudata TaxID=314043 RepID=A0AA39XG72_9PEZI|nr:hypothetical protein B0T14DRAFT_506744 [Immersiella caudata]
MGNICGKQPSSFSSPGRPLGTTPTAPTTASVPSSVTPNKSPKAVGGPPRRLGGASEGNASTSSASNSPDEARRKAALAAEARAQGSKGGDLSKKLAEQRKLTHRATLEEASKKNLREREVDALTEALRNT